MARQFGIGPIPTSPKDAVLILERDCDPDREANLAAIDKCFRLRKTQNCELVICIMDSAWNDLRANIKLNGTVTYGSDIRGDRIEFTCSLADRYHHTMPALLEAPGADEQVPAQSTRQSRSHPGQYV